MAASVFDSPLFARAYPTGDAARLMSDSAAVRAMLLVLGTLARAQGEAGKIPTDSAFFIHRSAMEVQIDPAGLAQGMARDGTPVPALITAFAKAMEAPEHSRFIGQDAASQDIADTALMLRLRQLLALLAPQAAPELAAELPDLRATCLSVAWSGAPAPRAALAEALKLADPGAPWPADRAPVLGIAGWLARATAPHPALARHGAALLSTLRAAPGPETEALALPQIALGAAAALAR